MMVGGRHCLGKKNEKEAGKVNPKVQIWHKVKKTLYCYFYCCLEVIEILLCIRYKAKTIKLITSFNLFLNHIIQKLIFKIVLQMRKLNFGQN